MQELMIALQSNDKIPFYEQIYQAIRRDIEDGKISCGEKLPSTRLLASNLAVSRFTVELAYEQLVSEGYIRSRAGSGFFACDLVYHLAPDHNENTSKKNAMHMREESLAYRIDFSPYAIDEQHFPYNVWRRRSKEVLDDEENLLRTTGTKGDLSLRRQIATYLYRARGVKCEPEQIIVGAGNDTLLSLLVQLIDGQPTVIMENPTYVQAYQTLQRSGCKVCKAATDGDGILLSEEQKSRADIVYVMPSHQFPLGTVMPLKRRLALLDWANEKEGRYIIEDDHDSEFRYIGKPIPSLQSRDSFERVIYMGTFSKSITPSLRMSYMVLPEALLSRFDLHFDFYSSTVSTQQQRTVCRFMEAGDFERHLNRMRRNYKAKHDHLLQELKKRKWVKKISGANAGLHLVVEVAGEYSEPEILKKAAVQGVKIYGLKEYAIGEYDWSVHPTLLLGFGGLSIGQIDEGLRILDQILEKKACYEN
ncbi:MAG: PLP-dependent aminotransferase family protein [bacterium]|nr:PLP-dependent aminotransferase family protein [bacterium]